MTYTIGLQLPGVNAIISDARVTPRPDAGLPGYNRALKTGLLFPGCLFGRVGSAHQSRRFILQFKSTIDGTEDTLRGFWNRFVDYATSYPFPKSQDQQFKILLTSRASGVPRFYLLDSACGLASIATDRQYDLFQFGTGEALLADLVLTDFIPRIEGLREHLLEDTDLPLQDIHWFTPYFLCLWLNELSLTFESSILEDHGVGGVFHFVIQNKARETGQGPALYILSTADLGTRDIYAWIYRVAYVQGGLRIEINIPPHQIPGAEEGYGSNIHLFDGASRLDVTGIPQRELEHQIEEELDSLPFFNFCGFGFAAPRLRRSYACILSDKGQRDQVFDENQNLLPHLRQVLISNFESLDDLA